MVVKPGTPPQTTPMELGLGSSADEPISLDIDVLLWTNLLVQAAPGAGKSWVLRRLAEEAWGRVPFIVIDPEGEFASLREVAGYVLVGPGGEAPAHVQSAGEVARRLLKLRASAVCDIFELDVEERHQWVREFLRALDTAPKAIWGHVLIALDEAHVFCPEKGEDASPATGAVSAIASRGRKRGFGLIAITQRLAALKKSVAAFQRNVLIGQTDLDVDQERAARSMLVPRREQERFFRELRALEPGHFLARGPALRSPSGAKPSLHRPIVIGPVRSTHPRPGSARAYEPPPPPEALRALLPQLADLPALAEAKRETPEELRDEVERLRRALAEQEARPPRTERVPFVPDRVVDELADLGRRLQKVRDYVETLGHGTDAKVSSATAVAAPASARTAPATPSPAAEAPRRAAPAPRTPGSLPRGARVLLEQLAGRHPKSLTRSQLATLACMTPKGSTLRTYLGLLMTARLVERDGEGFVITDAGLAKAGPVTRPTTPKELLELWRQKLVGRSRDMLELLAVEHGPFTQAELAARLDLDPSGSTLRTYLGHLKTNGLVRRTTRGVTITPELAL